MELRKPGFSTVKQQANTHKISFKKNKKRYLCMYLLIYLFIHISIYNKGGKTHWRLAGRCPLGVSICLSVAGTGTAIAWLFVHVLPGNHTYNECAQTTQ